MKDQTALVRLQRDDDGVVLITLDNPPVNALTRPLFTELRSVAEAFDADPPGAAVLTGLPKVFALGGEISEIYRTRFQGRRDIGDDELDAAVGEVIDPHYVRELGEKYLATFNAFANLPCVLIAAIGGLAFGGGLELTLTCDYRIASERAKLAAPEVTLGGASIGGGVVRLPRVVGPSMTKKLYLGGRPISAAEALRIGLVDEVVPPEETVERAIGLAREFATYAGPAQTGLKRMIDSGFGLNHEEADQMELEMWCASYATDAARMRLRAFFAHGPQPSDTPSRTA